MLHRAGLASGAGKAGLLEEMARDRPVHHAEYPSQRIRIGGRFEFVDETVGGSVPREFIAFAMNSSGMYRGWVTSTKPAATAIYSDEKGP